MKKWPWHLGVLAAAWVWLVIYAYPGQMTADSVDHMREAIDRIYTDAHPPILDVFWRITAVLPSPPLGWLLIQTGLLLAGLHALFRRTFSPRAAALWTAGVFVFPPVFTVMGVIWKDCIMAGLLAVGFAALLAGPSHRAKQLLGLLALTGAAAVRYNALGATAPLIVLVFEMRPGLRWFARYPIAIAVWLVSTALALGVNFAITDKEMHYADSSLLPYDIAGTLAHVDTDLPDPAIEKLLDGTGLRIHDHIHAAIKRVYTPRDFLPILNDPHDMLWDLPTDGYDPAPEAQRAAIERAWKTTITTYPGAYLTHRIAVMGEILDVHNALVSGGVPHRDLKRGGEYSRAHGVDVDASGFQRSATVVYNWISRHSPLYLPWIYALVALALLWFARGHRDLIALVLSGLGLDFSLLPLVHSRDFRYSHWLVVATLVAAISCVSRRYSAKRRSSAPAS